MVSAMLLFHLRTLTSQSASEEFFLKQFLKAQNKTNELVITGVLDQDEIDRAAKSASLFSNISDTSMAWPVSFVLV